MKIEWDSILQFTLSIIVTILFYYCLYRLIMHIIKSAIRYKIEYEYKFKQEIEMLNHFDELEKEINDFEETS